MAGIHQATTVHVNNLKYQQFTISAFTFSRKSLPDLYGCLNGFLCRFPALKLLTFKQSKNLSNISTKSAVSETSSPPVNLRPLPTDSLRTCQCVVIYNDHICMYIHLKLLQLTWAAKSTRILENEVRYTCSYLSRGRILSPGVSVLAPEHLLYKSIKCFHRISLPFRQRIRF